VSDSHPSLTRLKGGLIVSCQPAPGGPLDGEDIVVGLVLASLAGGAVIRLTRYVR
jgi:putative N-acetylmannosamine-6-phosphate epimerase